MATGYGTLNTDWYMEIAEARAKGDKRRENYAVEKIANKIGLSNLIQQDLRAQKNPQLSEEAAMWRRKRRAQLGHYCKWQRAKGEIEPMLRLREIETNFPLEYYLVESWLCFPAGPWPGLMFWSNTAMTKWLFARMGKDQTSYGNLGRDYVQKTRQRLGLLPVNGKRPVIEDIQITASNDGGLRVEGYGRNRIIVFEGERRPRH